MRANMAGMQILKGQYWANNYFCLKWSELTPSWFWLSQISQTKTNKQKKKRGIYGIPDADRAPRWGMMEAERRHESVKRAAEGLRYKAERI